MAERYRLVLRDEKIDLSKMKEYERGKLARTTEDIKILRQLAKDENDEVREYVASNKNTPVDVLKILAKDRDKDVREYVAYNKNTPVNVLKILAKDEDEWVREYVAKNPNTPVDLLRQLANDENWVPRWEVASNKNTPVNILRQLANDKDMSVRKNVAQNPNTPLDILKMLASDESEDVRYKVNNNPVYRKFIKSNKYSNKYYNNTITLKDITIGKCKTLNEPEVQQAYYFIFHTLIPVEVKNEKFVLTTSWFTGDREDVYENMDEYGENIPWYELLNEAECSDNWELISKSKKSYIYEGDLDSCLETIFEDYSISDKDFNTVKNEILRKNKLENLNGSVEESLLNRALEDSKFRDSKLRDTPRVNTLGGK